MKSIGPELDKIITLKGMMKKNVAEQLNMHQVSFSRILRKHTIECELLDKICKVIDVDPGVFFGDEIGEKEAASFYPKNETCNLGDCERLRMLNELLREKERLIHILIQTKGFNIGTNSGQTE